VAVADDGPRDARPRAVPLPEQTVLELPVETVPADKFRLLVAKVEELAEKNNALQNALTASERKVGYLKGEIRKLTDDGVIDEDVQEVLDLWADGRRVQQSTLKKYGSRWNTAAKAVREHGKDLCLLVVEGNKKAPWQFYDLHLPMEVPGSRKRDALRYLFADGDRIEYLADLADKTADEIMADYRRREGSTEPKLDDVHWSKVWRANRKRLTRYLERKYGPPIQESEADLGRYADDVYPCPNCAAPYGDDVVALWPELRGKLAPTLRVVSDRRTGVPIARCTRCGIDDFRLMINLLRRKPREAVTSGP
jgi:FtsZ-binding cell division protein ZapB